ncbi:MAG: hypothetical protein OCD76_07265 [Reichenbachiella sp.]
MRYDSKFEEDLHKGPLKGCKFHTESIPYLIKRMYEPDFIKGKFYIEAKGRFRDRNESNKYIWIAKALPKGKELVFIFMNHKTPMPNAKRRKKCGTKQSVGEWATKNNIRWYTPRTCPIRWSK